MGLVVWYYVVTAAGELRRVTTREWNAFSDGKGEVPKLRATRVRYVQVLVECEGGKPERVDSIGFFDFPLTSMARPRRGLLRSIQRSERSRVNGSWLISLSASLAPVSTSRRIRPLRQRHVELVHSRRVLKKLRRHIMPRHLQSPPQHLLCSPYPEGVNVQTCTRLPSPFTNQSLFTSALQFPCRSASSPSLADRTDCALPRNIISVI
jgi:hypothetical protein